ncbi:hypothetical protein BASA83_010608 [Batrachochytrium salamandrivorans]|nr:hypothetical protein BASA83_010608 [Batrachochytrium salamandrivorans]
MPIGKKRIRSINNSDNLLTLSIHSLSSRNKLLLPGTLRLGSISYVNTLFVDCGADDLFMDSKLAQDLKFPLVKLPNPIKLRLADERHNPKINWVSRMVEFDSSFCLENCCVSSSRIQGLGKPPDPKMVFPTVPTSDLENDPIQIHSQKESITELSVLEEPEPMENVGFKKPISFTISKKTQDIISANSIHADIYPFVEATSKSEEDVPKEILSEFAGCIRKGSGRCVTATSKF